jgi:hypothetical protein
LGVFQGFPGQLQQQTLLGVHVFGFFLGNAEKTVVEAFHVVHDAGGKGAGTAGRGAAGMQECVDIETVGRDVGDGVTPLGQQFPEGFQRAYPTRQTAGQPDDGNLHGTLPSKQSGFSYCSSLPFKYYCDKRPGPGFHYSALRAMGDCSVISSTDQCRGIRVIRSQYRPVVVLRTPGQFRTHPVRTAGCCSGLGRGRTRKGHAGQNRALVKLGMENGPGGCGPVIVTLRLGWAATGNMTRMQSLMPTGDRKNRTIRQWIIAGPPSFRPHYPRGEPFWENAVPAALPPEKQPEKNLNIPDLSSILASLLMD